jgi:Rieske Fe-S protein
MDSAKRNSASEPDCTACPLQQSAVSRRDFLSAAMLTTIAATLTACGGGELGGGDEITAPATPSTPSTPTTPAVPGNPTVGANQIGVTIASFPALAVVGGVAKVSSNPAVALARTSTGFVAYSLRCPHAGTTVTIGTNNALRCPNHGATFSSTGVWTGGQRSSNLVARTVTANTAKTFVVVNLV